LHQETIQARVLRESPQGNLVSRRINVDKSASHHLSQFEIGGDNPCSQQLSKKCALRTHQADYFRMAGDTSRVDAKHGNHFLQADFSGLISILTPTFPSGQYLTEEQLGAESIALSPPLTQKR
jgi:hypothetical protein